MQETMIEVLDDDRVREILQGLAKGKTRDELAEQFGHKNYRTLDIYMRRRNFIWDSQQQMYKLESDEPQVATVDTSKAYRITQLIAQQEELDLQRIAQLMNFEGYKALAAYMAANDYSWSAEQNNYVKVKKPSTKLIADESKISKESTEPTLPQLSIFLDENGGEYLDLLKMLKANELRLLQILQPYGAGGQIPRYTIPGVAKTKTVQMIHSLDQMVTDFAKEKNMTQRDVFEVALIDFFKRYGYERQVELLLK